MDKSLQEDKVTSICSISIMCLKHTKYFPPIKTLQGKYDDLSNRDDKSKDQRGSVTHPGSRSSNAEFRPKQLTPKPRSFAL